MLFITSIVLLLQFLLTKEIFSLSVSSHFIFIFQRSFQTSHLFRHQELLPELSEYNRCPLFAQSTILHTINLVSYNINIICLYMSLYMIKVFKRIKKKTTIFYSLCIINACYYIHHVGHIKKIDLEINFYC